jgi:hypothetical protein
LVKLKLAHTLKGLKKWEAVLKKDQKKLETMVDTMKLKNLTSQGKKTN